MATNVSMEDIVNQVNDLYLHTIKEKAVNDITNKLLEDFKAEAEPIVKKEVNRLVSMHTEHWKDIYQIGENIKVIMEWNSK
jgi:hypothetical protein